MDRNRQIRNLVTSVLFRILLFLVYYIGLIVLGLAIIVGIAYASFAWLPDVLIAVSNIRLIILCVIIWAGLCSFALVFGAYLVKPLFSSTKSINNQRVEVSEKDCPELFAMIKDVAKGVGTKMPKHVYLTTDVNACVFYNTTFWSIFFPVRKNLEIGLGLFEGLSEDELKSIIAHEFGHFSQNSMKVGSTVYVANSVIYGLINTKDSWDRMIENWRDSTNQIWATFGLLTDNMTNWVKSLTYDMYKFVQRPYMALSRQMEFDADTISCNYVGIENFVSAMYKVEKISSSAQLYQHILGNLVSEHKIVADYFKCKIITDERNPEAINAGIKYDVPITEYKDTRMVKSRVEIKDIWNSHPSLEDRIKNAKETGIVKSPGACLSAWELVSEDVIKKVSDRFLAIVWNNHQEGKLDVLSDVQYDKWVDDFFKTSFINAQMRPYFNRRIVPFSLDEIKVEEPIENPFTQANGLLLEQFKVAWQDLELLEQISSNQIEVDRIKYDGTIYEDEIHPYGEQKKYVDEMVKKVGEVDKDIYHYLSYNAKDEDRKLLCRLYEILFYSYHINNITPQLMQGRDSFYHELSRNIERNEEQFAFLSANLSSYIRDVQATIKQYDYAALSGIYPEEHLIKANEFAKEEIVLDDGISGELINTVFQIVGEMYIAHKELEERVTYTLAKIADVFITEGKIIMPSKTENSDADKAPDEGNTESINEEEIHDGNDDPFGASELASNNLQEDVDENSSSMRVLFIVLAIVVIGGIGYSIFDNNNHSTTNNIVAESLQDYEEQDPVPQQYNNIVEEEGQQTLAENEITDGNVIIAIPTGVVAVKQDVGDGTFVYDLVNDKENPVYAIRVLSSYSKTFSNNEFEQIWAQAKQQNEEGTVSADYGQLVKGSVGNMESYSRTTTYHGDSDSYWRLIVLNNFMTGQIAILSCWYSNENDIPIDKIVAGIRF